MALYNHLFARRNQGKWILRIEDTDKVLLSFIAHAKKSAYLILESLCSRVDRRHSKRFKMGSTEL